ncbi:MAG: hypothetical protein A2X86_01990 [Bdellovibrionales bacterium GWA2_49_15]|nr:MAG: hypothetical protein A2X86_01990 [Bdellovibrionales bacterium GWA2_49_15]
MSENRVAGKRLKFFANDLWLKCAREIWRWNLWYIERKMGGGMNLKNLKNEVLVQNTKNLIKEENRILAKVLAHFQEIETRKLYLELGYGSLFLFAVKELGYKEASAQRRIEAMRFINKTPEARPIVEKGDLNLSNLSLLERVSREAQATHAQNVAALNLIQEEPTSGGSGNQVARIF